MKIEAENRFRTVRFAANSSKFCLILLILLVRVTVQSTRLRENFGIWAGWENENLIHNDAKLDVIYSKELTKLQHPSMK